MENTPAESGPLVDAFGRAHSSLRVSVTDRCNIRCTYCMPIEHIRFLPRAQVLTYEEIVRLVKVMATLGVRRVRLTGGEPLVREELHRLIEQLTRLNGLEEVALTTNGVLLAKHAQALYDAGLARLNISLDALDKAAFKQVARRDGLQDVLQGIDAAQRVGFKKIRLNAIAMKGLTEEQIVPLAGFARERELELRFIEFMPLDADEHWQRDGVLTGAEVRSRLEQAFGRLTPVERDDPSQPAVDYRFDDGPAVGFINPVSQPFCGDCNRLRLTAEGQVRNCLFSTQVWDARALLRSGADDSAIAQLVRDCVAHKKPGHGIDEPGFLRPDRAMYQIGG